jgi:hypothetical protein
MPSNVKVYGAGSSAHTTSTFLKFVSCLREGEEQVRLAKTVNQVGDLTIICAQEERKMMTKNLCRSKHASASML